MTPARESGTILHPGLPASDPVFVRPERGMAKTDRPAVVVSIVAARSLLGIGCSSSPLFDLCHSQTLLAAVDLLTAAVGFSAVADLDPAAAAAAAAAAVVVVVPGFAGFAFADSACLVYSSAAVAGKGRAVVVLVASYFLARRSSFLRSRSSLSPLCFAVPA